MHQTERQNKSAGTQRTDTNIQKRVSEVKVGIEQKNKKNKIKKI